MTKKLPNYVSDSKWSKDPKKIEARNQTIILPYRKFFSQSLPPEKQYWTMCSSYYDSNGKTTGELHQLIEDGLISANQFYPVDINPDIIEKNKEYYPDINWICDDFIEAMKKASIEGNFNPGIINCDNVRQYKNAILYLKKLLYFIDNNVFGELLLISNLMLNNPYGDKSKKDLIDKVIKYLLKNYTVPDHWAIHPQYYEYNGTGNRSQTTLGSILFIKSKHKEIKITKDRRICVKE